MNSDGIRNFKRISKPFIILANLFSYNIPTKVFNGLQRRQGTLSTNKHWNNYFNLIFWMNWNKNEPLFDFSIFKTNIMETISLDLSSQYEEDEYNS
jgi:hypothetical protein